MRRCYSSFKRSRWLEKQFSRFSIWMSELVSRPSTDRQNEGQTPEDQIALLAARQAKMRGRSSRARQQQQE